jgi:hypothetical protein
MNERIDQLRLEAGISRLHDEPKFMVAVSKEGTVIEPLDGLEKFAELIVKDCISIAKLQRYNMQCLASNPPQSAAAYDIERNIMNHFGVQE